MPTVIKSLRTPEGYIAKVEEHRNTRMVILHSYHTLVYSKQDNSVVIFRKVSTTKKEALELATTFDYHTHIKPHIIHK